MKACGAAGVTVSVAGCLDRVRQGPSDGSGDDGRGDDELVDDWVYFSEEDGGGSWSLPSSFVGQYALESDVAESAPTDSADSIGLAAGGAADVGAFRRNVREGYLPIPESVAYEGLFHEYYFDTGGVDGETCTSLFCPTYTPALSNDPLSGDEARYLSVGLDSGMSKEEFERPPLNLVVVLDVSGSMTASFDEYYYDQYGGRYYYDEHGNRQEVEEENPRPKMEVAKEALVSMTQHLRPDDRFGVVLFNNEAHLAKPVGRVGDTDMDAIREHIREEVHAGGGTNISAGLELSEEILEDADVVGEDSEDDGYETRSVLLTDAQVNWGETGADELQSSLSRNADEGHHTSVVGIGVDFNADLISRITEVQGANYYNVYTEAEFDRRMDDEFEYMVSPLVFDLSLELHTEGWEIEKVYGAPSADEDTGEVMHVDTLFPSPSEDGDAKGGVVLTRLSDVGGGDTGSVSLEASWETHEGDQRSVEDDVELSDGTGYGNDAVRKAVLLSRYADLLKNWVVHERANADDGGRRGGRRYDRGDDGGDEPIADAGTADSADDEIVPPPPEPPGFGLSEWELQSVPLSVTEPYDDRLREFRDHLEAEKNEIGDEDLAQEAELLDRILES